ncbi:MAG: hypothetical protein CM15mV5_2010 [uncultured marine virus]|jgi:hypothetical protein|nr:MAG: hypothetical protein CM15mV5_2010 [uncultured marine virus]|tara:strand:- start:140 stop:394 length:255 start_codon:yes stop_codon:yes gene_type:complete
MYILTIKGKEDEGAYAPNVGSNNVLYLFEEEEDAERHAELLKAEDYPDMRIIQVEDDIAVQICEDHGYTYCVVTPDDIIIPPRV